MTRAELLARYRKRHGALIEPRQGFGSLDSSLHLAYSIGRVRGFTDLGTFVNKPGDHGIGPRSRDQMRFPRMTDSTESATPRTPSTFTSPGTAKT